MRVKVVNRKPRKVHPNMIRALRNVLLSVALVATVFVGCPTTSFADIPVFATTRAGALVYEVQFTDDQSINDISDPIPACLGMTIWFDQSVAADVSVYETAVTDDTVAEVEFSDLIEAFTATGKTTQSRQITKSSIRFVVDTVETSSTPSSATIVCSNIAWGGDGLLTVNRLLTPSSTVVLTADDVRGSIISIDASAGGTIELPSVSSLLVGESVYIISTDATRLIITPNANDLIRLNDEIAVTGDLVASEGIGIHTTGTASLGGADAQICLYHAQTNRWGDCGGTLRRWEFTNLSRDELVQAEVTTGPSDPTADCTLGDLYTETTTNDLWLCNPGDTWTEIVP